MQVEPDILLFSTLNSVIDSCRRAVVDADGHALGTGRALLYLDMSKDNLQPSATVSISICYGGPAEMVITGVVGIEIHNTITGTIGIYTQTLAYIVVASYDL